MAKKKSSMALFEAMSRSREKDADESLGVPGWMGKNRQAAQRRAESAPPAKPTPAGRAKVESGSPAARVSRTGGRLNLSLTHGTCVAIGVVAIVLLGLAFWAGRASVAGGNGDAATRAGVAGGGNDGRTQTGDGGSGAATTTRREPGKYYLVIETLQGDSPEDRGEAERIVEFLAARGEPAEVRTLDDRYVVWSLTPLDSPTSEAAMTHARTVEKMGQEYFRTYRTYRFQQRRRPDAELDPWYIQA